MTNKESKIIKLKMYHDGKSFTIERDEYWNIHITPVGKSLGKSWRYWYKYRKTKIRDIEIHSGIKQVVKATRGRYGSTWITFELATQVLSSWSNSLAFQLVNCFRNKSNAKFKKS